MSSNPMPEKKDPHSTTIGVAGGGGPPYDGDMELRIEKIESNLDGMKLDLEIIKRTGATKMDLAELKIATKVDIAELRTETKTAIAELKAETMVAIAELKAETKADIAELKAELISKISEAKTSVIIWVTSAIFLAQLLPALLKLFIK